jgi:iron complex transport system substrate-binding protein
MRIASFLASGTELVCALGAGDQLVGRSHECDRPAWVKDLPVLSRPTFATEVGSGEIDRQVRAKLQAGAPLYQIDEAALTALAPDVVITQTHCEVCAVDASAGCAVLNRRPVIALRTGTVDGILEGFKEVAMVLGLEEAGQALIDAKQAHIARWQEATASLPRVPVVVVEWVEPTFVLANWGPELVNHAGGEPLLARHGAHSASLPWEQVRIADPEVIVVAPCGFSLERTLDEMPILRQRSGWSSMKAVRAGRVYAADGNIYFNRSGPSLFETIDILAELLHPDRFPPLHEGIAWKRWP